MARTPQQLDRLRRGITPAIRREVLGENGMAWCHYCGFPGFEVDHVVPVTRGGGLDPENLVPVCSECNGEKSDQTVDEWALARRRAGKPWPITHINDRIIDMHKRDEPWPWAPGLNLGYEALYEWIGKQPGGHKAMRRYLVDARDRTIGGGA